MSLVEKAKPLLARILSVDKLYQNFRLLYFLFRSGSFRFIRKYPPGHYYSPIPNYKEIEASSQKLFRRDIAECPGISLREGAQLQLLESFSRYYKDLPFSAAPSRNMRYFYDNAFFSYGSGIILYSFLRHYRPRRVIEIGSGFSSALMLDINKLYPKDEVHCTFIEPYPKRLLNLLTQEDEPLILEKKLQDVPPEIFGNLSENDLLFIDSSHVVKTGSDLVQILFHILPRLKTGVIIHFHDIFWPFEYPEDWLHQGRAWNETYFLRSFLQYNNAFEILYFNSFVAECHTDALREKLPLCLNSPGSSIWLRKS